MPSSASLLVDSMMHCEMPSSGRSDGWGDGDPVMMKFLDSSFLDLGSGNGLVCAASMVNGGFSRATGIEIDVNQVIWAQKRLVPRLPNLTMISGDILNWRYLPHEHYTHVLSFDKEYPPEVCFHVLEQMVTNAGTWCVWATARSLKWWHSFLAEYVHGWQAYEGSVEAKRATAVIEGLSRLEQIKSIRVNLCISREGHAIYLMRCFK